MNAHNQGMNAHDKDSEFVHKWNEFVHKCKRERRNLSNFDKIGLAWIGKSC